MRIIVNISGGLGNQMFQYAAAYSFAKKKGFELILDISDYKKIKNREFQLKLIFSINNKIATNNDLNELLGYKKFFLVRRFLKKLHWSSDKILIEKPYNFNTKFSDIRNSIYLQGYWQNYNYFSSYKNKIREIFMFQALTKEETQLFRNFLHIKNLTSVHIRRGDYISKKNKNIFYQLDESYYRDSIGYIESKVDNPHFLIFSDDYNWVRKNLKCSEKKFTLMDFTPDTLSHFKLMCLCKHHIIANSTFSWWPAWLKKQTNDKIVIAPKKWLNGTFQPSGLIMPSWKRF